MTKEKLQEAFRHCVSIDLETTGLDPKYHAVVEAGACPVFGDDSSCFVECWMPHYTVYNPKALEVNGHTQEELRSRNAMDSKCLSQAEMVLTLLDYCERQDRTVLVGKNPSFDYKFLLHIWTGHLGREERTFPLSYRLIDYGGMAIKDMVLAGKTVPPKGFSSNDVQDFYDIPREPMPHNGLTGARYNVVALEKIFSYNNPKI